ncbi:MAG: ThuA domain-containing protein [Verrucomicrobiota bacterium]
MKTPISLLVLSLAGFVSVGSAAETAKKNVLLIAGKPSHGPGQHEHNAGVQLLAKCLKEGAADRVDVQISLGGQWPEEAVIKKADTIVMYSDGGGGHVASGHFDQVAEQLKRGCGLVCLHYAVEPAYEPENWPEFVRNADGKPGKQTVFNPARTSKGVGAKELKDGLGGYFEQFWSVNPHWTADFKELPKHPISSGVKPFSTNDEWYYHMRFREGMKRVTPILSDVPPTSTTERGEGSHSGNPDQKRDVLELKAPQHVAWTVDREDGGRGFGFTGGHFHAGWGNNDQRKLVLNAILWTAKAEVPATGVESAVSEEELKANLDPKQPPKPKTPEPAAK